MRHLHLLLLAFVFMFTAQVHAAKTKKVKTTSSISVEGKGMKIRMNSIPKKTAAQQDRNTSQLQHASPKANTGSASCPFRNAAFSPFSNHGKLTQVKRMLPGNEYNLRATAIN